MDEFQQPNRLLKADEVAARLGVRPETVRNLHKSSKLRGFKVGRELRWRLSDVMTFIADLPDAAY